MTLKVTRAEFLGIDRMDEDELRDNVLDLLVENAKLRELLAELYENQCDECDRWKYRDRMRELGVEA